MQCNNSSAFDTNSNINNFLSNRFIRKVQQSVINFLIVDARLNHLPFKQTSAVNGANFFPQPCVVNACVFSWVAMCSPISCLEKKNQLLQGGGGSNSPPEQTMSPENFVVYHVVHVRSLVVVIVVLQFEHNKNTKSV